MITAPMTAHPSTAPSTKGKPCTATASSDSSDRYCAVTMTSATTRTRVRAPSTQAIRDLMSGPPFREGETVVRRRQADLDPRSTGRRRVGGERPVHRLHAVAHVRHPAPDRGAAHVEASTVVLDVEAH